MKTTPNTIIVNTINNNRPHSQYSFMLEDKSMPEKTLAASAIISKSNQGCKIIIRRVGPSSEQFEYTHNLLNMEVLGRYRILDTTCI